MTIPHQRADTFWFTLFHVLYHMINVHLGHLFYVDFDSSQGKNDTAADEYAREMLISYNTYRKFPQSICRKIMCQDVGRLAKTVDVLLASRWDGCKTMVCWTGRILRAGGKVSVGMIDHCFALQTDKYAFKLLWKTM